MGLIIVWLVPAFFFVMFLIATADLGTAVAGSIVFVLFAMKVTVKAHLFHRSTDQPSLPPNPPPQSEQPANLNQRPERQRQRP